MGYLEYNRLCDIPDGKIALKLILIVAQWLERSAFKLHLGEFFSIEEIITFQVTVPAIIVCVDRSYFNRETNLGIRKISFGSLYVTIKSLEGSFHFRHYHVLNGELYIRVSFVNGPFCGLCKTCRYEYQQKCCEGSQFFHVRVLF